ncbi:hypothetical protein Tco_0692332 [Tanacetum coccineum]
MKLHKMVVPLSQSHLKSTMAVKLCYGVADLMYYHFLRPRLGLDYGLHTLNVDADVLEMPASFVEGPIVVESTDDPFEDHDEILGEYANTGKQIIGDEITWKVGPIRKFKEVEVDADNESEEEIHIRK